jgi:hypothetical protein
MRRYHVIEDNCAVWDLDVVATVGGVLDRSGQFRKGGEARVSALGFELQDVLACCLIQFVNIAKHTIKAIRFLILCHSVL